MRSLFVSGLTVLVITLASTPSRATLIGVELVPEPDTVVTSANLSYDASSDMLTIDFGLVSDLDFNGINNTIQGVGMPGTFGNLNLSALVDETGTFTGGTFTLTGEVLDGTGPGVLFGGPTLLTGTLTDFGFDANGMMDFTFRATDGSMKGIYGDGLNIGGIVLNNSGIDSNDLFLDDFTSNFGSTVDVGVVPEPSSLILVGLGLGGLIVARARRCA